MTGIMAALIFLTTAALIQTVKVPQRMPLSVAEVGENVTLLRCPVSEKYGKFIHWYKLPLGYMIQTVATGTYTKQQLGEQFEDRFKITEGASEYNLTIRNVSKEDEATYFCQSGTAYNLSFAAGIYLAVNDRIVKKLTNVRQTPETVSVQKGDTVTSECTLLSKSKENTDPCPGENRVYWFRVGLEESHPSFIYTHKNNSDAQERRSCIYRLSRTIKDSSDTGTYYCAVVAWGEILFGQGTKVKTVSALNVNVVIIVLSTLLACCVTVIVTLIVYIKQRLYKGMNKVANNHGDDRSTRNQSNEMDADAVNYVALNFSKRKVKGLKKKKKESPQECVYSAVRAGHQTPHDAF